jgi:hypothetical protein
MPDEAKRKNPFLYTTIHNLTTGVRKPEFVYSKDFIKFIKGDLASYLNYYNKLSLNSSAKKIFNNNITEIFSSHNENDPFNSVISHSSGLYNFIFLLSEPKSFINYRWCAINELDQKFYKMFLTNSMQQRIHGN